MTFQEIILNLQQFWADYGCLIHQPCDIEVGAGTFNPATFLRCLGPEPWNAAYVEPSRRPTDGRYGENPYRLGAYYQYQVILKPAPTDVLPLYLESLKYLGIDPKQHDFRFVEDDWESPTLGASGLGWEVWWNGAEITQFTYFQQMGSQDLNPICAELTYGLERIALYLQDVNSVYEIQWNHKFNYGDIHHQAEVEYSKYSFNHANTEMLLDLFNVYEKEAFSCLDQSLVLPATDYVLKASHAFNLLDARGVISVTERVGYIERVRRLAQRATRAYIDQRQDLGHPLLIAGDNLDDREKPLAYVPSSNQDLRSKAEVHYISTGPRAERQDFLLEIGTEEIPAGYIQPALNQLSDLAKYALTEQRLSFDQIRVLGTPRRLTLAIKNIDLRQADQTVEVTGPPKQVAYDDGGNPTRAAIGFAKSQRVSVADLQLIQTERGEYVFATQLQKGRPTSDILAEVVGEWIRALNFPKTMRWDSPQPHQPSVESRVNLRFARPIRWLVALLGSEVVPLQMETLITDRMTYGHRSLNPEPILLAEANLDTYTNQLQQANVIVDPQLRRAEIQWQLEQILSKEECAPDFDQELLTEVNYLVENPEAIVGTFSPEHLDLPIEVLTTYMKKHQRYFPILKADGNPIAKFVTISNGSDGNIDAIRHGNERVLRSRFEDAAFYYEEDQQSSLADKVDRLKDVIFQVRLGSLHDKTNRLQQLVRFIGEQMGLSTTAKEEVKRTAYLCKADLTTQMVIGFPSLQGTMGKYYALGSDESSNVATAIEEHYCPVSAEGDLPKSEIGSVVSIADKIDTIVGYFGIEERPTGSQDRYSLRRQAIGILRILQERQIPLLLDQVVEQAIQGYITDGIGLASDTKVAVLDFLRGRFQMLLQDQGFEYDEVNATLAVLATDNTTTRYLDVSDVEKRVKLVHDFRRADNFNQIYPALNRILRILPEIPQTVFEPASVIHAVDPDLFQEKAERQLGELVRVRSAKMWDLNCNREYDKLLLELIQLQPAIDQFFDQVLIMAEEPAVKANRLALLSTIATHICAICDFRELVITTGK